MCIRDRAGLIAEGPRIYFWISVFYNSLKKVQFGLQTLIFQQNYSIILDLNASNPSERVPITGPQCPQSIWKGPYYWTSMPLIHLKGSLLLDLNAPDSTFLMAWGHWPPIMRDLADGLEAFASNYTGPVWGLKDIVLELCGTFLMAWRHWPPIL